MNYSDALNYIHGTLKFGSKLGLYNISDLLELMGNPHKKLRFVHVAGTNGKGSTVAFISSILKAAGYKVGVYTSPYLQRFSERIKVNDAEVPEEELARITAFVKEKVDVMVERGDNHPTEFEIVTAIGLQYYYECGCDMVVLEVGLGGRFDATNVIDTPMAAVITTISYDHMSILGDTLPKIAYEKAGIMKPKGDIVIYPQAREVEQVFGEVSTERGCRLYRADFNSLQMLDFSVDGQVFNYKAYKELKIALLGEHQTKNAAVAVEAVEVLKSKGLYITESAIRAGLAAARWPGRLEVVCKKPLFLIDGAHNWEGAQVLAEALEKYFPNKRRIFLFGVLRDKDYRSILEAVASADDTFITVTPSSERALPSDELAEIVRKYCNHVITSDKIKDGVDTALSISKENDVICAFGSLYYIGEIRDIFEV